MVTNNRQIVAREGGSIVGCVAAADMPDHPRLIDELDGNVRSSGADEHVPVITQVQRLLKATQLFDSRATSDERGYVWDWCAIRT